MKAIPCSGLCPECHEQCASEDAEEWRELAAELRVQASRISGILMDTDMTSTIGMRSSLDAIGELINGPRSTSDPHASEKP